LAPALAYSEGLDRGTLKLEQIRALDSPGVAHIKTKSADPLSPGLVVCRATLATAMLTETTWSRSSQGH
jgi:hypothetical protein